ncbi:uncharacterized protein LOC127349539 [Dicentrarchus labrax]|uniref:uncharacterized protein LOC127349539 n=1 Tax=Dicentrarchus labrax TaxID=13489 RepID=UPI0021F6186C|nr:uncharacterized protein LOC127349539 [Dicentrarchus labrax]
MADLHIHQDILVTMTSLKLALYLTCLCLWRIALTTDVKLSPSVRQENGFISANVGDNVTLRCFHQNNETAVFSWYKQTLGQKPRIVSTYFEDDIKGTFTDEFKNNPRFTLETKKGKNHLTISNLHTSDSATYYCVVSCHAYKFEFKEGFTVSVEDSGLNIPASVHQSASESIQPGGSVTLNCTVHTGTCDGEHSVYWFKTSEESHPGLIYTHGGSNDQCERKPDTQTHTCVYNLPMQSLDLSHAGTYYCAVASCGHILFGDGTKLDYEDEKNRPNTLVYFLSGTLAFTTILTVLLAFSMCMMNKRNSCHCTESRARFSAASITNVEGYQGADKENKVNRRGGQRDYTWSECVYFTVK